MDETQKRLVRLALTLAEAKGKYGEDRSLYSTEAREIRDLLWQVTDEIVGMVTDQPVAAADADDTNLNFDLYKPALRVAE